MPITLITSRLLVLTTSTHPRPLPPLLLPLAALAYYLRTLSVKRSVPNSSASSVHNSPKFGHLRLTSNYTVRLPNPGSYLAVHIVSNGINLRSEVCSEQGNGQPVMVYYECYRLFRL